MKRLYYVGDQPGYTDLRLPGALLDYGNAVDVHDDELAGELLDLPHFSESIVAPRPVEIAGPLVMLGPEEEDLWLEHEEEDLEVDNGDT